MGERQMVGVLLAVFCHSASASFYCAVTATCPNGKIFLPYDASASSAGCRIGDGTGCNEATPFRFDSSQIDPSSCGVSSYSGIASKITFNSYMFDEFESCKTFMNNYLKPKAGVSRRADLESKGEVQAAACTCGDLVGSLLRMIPALDTSALPADANQRSLCTLLMQVAVGQLKSATCTKATSFDFGFPFVGSLVGKFCDTCFDEFGKPITDIVKGMCTNIIDTVFDKLMYPSSSSSTMAALVVKIRDDVEDAIDQTASIICGATVCRDSSSGGGECSVVPSWIPDSGKKVVNVVLQNQGLCSTDSDSTSSSDSDSDSGNSTGNFGSANSPKYAYCGIVSTGALVLANYV